ncbi:hypothetical protein Achl_0590 [Pseudarthrobacter chlorophenolicus A6]|uniref:Uncharacterized protein n=1 Tax=Pseudarthrobacter chlorophenolicus (strain ATCC 700700 / DSM 12829 / CIP 107037 / JCM 12360 / KCTC 9906 / NCIMB 13794 / A6) TaxID=452863 RepID=B8HBA4_PSECP|nr:hypothetical protein Achl_0590 [Pseudarthrobacter chlorophenolicus A6]
MLGAADLHTVGFEEKLLLRRAGRYKPQDVPALGDFFHLTGGYHMRMLHDLDVVANLE